MVRCAGPGGGSSRVWSGYLSLSPLFLSNANYSQKGVVGANPTTHPDHTKKISLIQYFKGNAYIEWFSVSFVKPKHAGIEM